MPRFNSKMHKTANMARVSAKHNSRKGNNKPVRKEVKTMTHSNSMPIEKVPAVDLSKLTKEELDILLIEVYGTPIDVFRRYGRDGSIMILKTLCEIFPEREADLKSSELANMVLSGTRKTVFGKIIVGEENEE